MQSAVSLGPEIVIEMHSILPQDLGQYNFDNFFYQFASIILFVRAEYRGTRLYSFRELQTAKLQRDIIAVKWHNKSILTIVSNCH